MKLLTGLMTIVLSAATPSEMARDLQDRAGLEKLVAEASAEVGKKPADAAAQYRVALAQSYLAEVALELRDKGAAARAAEAGIKAAQKAVELKPAVAENHRILGTLCGQIIPANTLLGLKYGRCALEEINKAIELDPKNAMAYLSRGVGNYYLPEQLGGGVDKSLADFQRASQMDPKLAEAHLWAGLALRKRNKNAEARAALEKALALNPKRVWVKQQLEKTPAK